MTNASTALAVIPNSSDVLAIPPHLAAEVENLKAKAKALSVTTPHAAEDAAALLAACKEIEDSAPMRLGRDYVSVANQLHKGLLAILATVEAPIKEARATVRSKLADYIEAQERERQRLQREADAAAQRLRDEADRIAREQQAERDRQRQQLTEAAAEQARQRREADAALAREMGDDEGAAAIMERPAVVDAEVVEEQLDMPMVPVLVMPARVPEAQKPAGTSTVKKWTGIGVDVLAFCRGLADGSVPSHLANLVKFDDVAIRRYATATRGTHQLPGIEFREEVGLRQR